MSRSTGAGPRVTGDVHQRRTPPVASNWKPFCPDAGASRSEEAGDNALGRRAAGIPRRPCRERLAR